MCYNLVFGSQLKAYNDKQKREDRKIKDYFVKLFGTDNEDTIVKNSNKQQSFYEYVVGIGGKENTALVSKTLSDGTEVKANPKAARIAAICLKEYILGNADIAPAYKEKYSRIFAKTQNKGRNDQNDSKLAETKPHRYYPAALA